MKKIPKKDTQAGLFPNQKRYSVLLLGLHLR